MKSRVTEIDRALFQERFQKINDNCNTEGWTVWDSIDRPIRPLVFELARVGMIPKFSCCGYSYESEEEPKTHHGKFAYVFFYAPAKYIKQFEELTEIIKRQGWGLHMFNGMVWHLHTANPVPDDLYNKADGIPEAIHQYEGYGLKIEYLAGDIQDNMKTVNKTIEIIDGNLSYSNFKTWIVKGKKNFQISVKDYYRQYGKVNYKELCIPADVRLGMELITSRNYESLKESLVK